MSTTPNYHGNPLLDICTIADTNGTTPVEGYVAPATGAFVTSVIVESDDSVAKECIMAIGAATGAADSAQAHINTISVPASSGQNATNKVVDLLDDTQGPWLDPAPGRGFPMKGNAALFFNVPSSLSAGKKLKITVLGFEY